MPAHASHCRSGRSSGASVESSGSQAVAQAVDGQALENEPPIPGIWAKAGWLVENPVGIPTEREVYAEQVTQGSVFRVLLQRTAGSA